MLDRRKCPILAFILLTLLPLTAYAWDSDELELFDLVEEIQQNFYEVLGLDASASSADIRRAYRRLSLQLHPDKNKEENAEEKFRQLVAVAEVLKNEDQRKRYDEVLEHGLPDWRQPVYYYRRVRKMGLVELSILLTLILTVGHYLVIWSIYWERCFELESIYPKKKKEKKNKKSNKQAVDSNSQTQPDPLSILDDPNILCKPHISDILPCQIFRLIKNMIFSIPSMVVWIGVQIENWKESRRKLKEEELEEEEEEEEEYDDTDKDRTKKRQRVDPALYEYDRTSVAPVGLPVASHNECDTNSAMNNGQPKSQQSCHEWTHEDTNKLIKAMAKYPGGTSARWDKIATEVGWPVEQITKKAKAIKSSGYATHVEAATQGITGGVQHSVVSKSGKVLSDDVTKLPNSQKSVPSHSAPSSNTNSAFNNFEEEPKENRPKKNKTAKPAKTCERTLMIVQSQDDVDNDDETSGTKRDDGASSLIHPGVESCAWTQRQQKVLEKALSVFPKGTDGRWDKIADAVPGKSKEECLVRYKELVEAIRRKKQTAGNQ